MSTVDSKATAAPKVQKRDTHQEDFEQLPYFHAQEGATFRGRIVRPFLVPDDARKGKSHRVVYEVEDFETGAHLGLNERGGFREAIRKCRIGTYFELTFRGKKDLPGTSFQAWDVDFSDAADGTGPVVSEELKRIHADMVKRGDDLPF